jgi:hypothetical protein
MAICALNYRGTVCCGIGGLLCAEYPADGVYYWIINYTDRNSKKISKNGSVTLLR